MSRHERDVVSLMAGLLLVVLAGLFLVTDLADVDLDGWWVLPVVLVAVGAAGLLSTVRCSRGGGATASGPGEHGVVGQAP